MNVGYSLFPGSHTHTQIHNEAMDISLQITQSRLENVIIVLFGMGKCSIMSCSERSRVHLNNHHNPPQLFTHLFLTTSLFFLSCLYLCAFNAPLILIFTEISNVRHVLVLQWQSCACFNLLTLLKGKIILELKHRKQETRLVPPVSSQTVKQIFTSCFSLEVLLPLNS